MKRPLRLKEVFKYEERVSLILLPNKCADILDCLVVSYLPPP